MSLMVRQVEIRLNCEDEGSVVLAAESSPLWVLGFSFCFLFSDGFYRFISF